jgi:hypothetical protein
MITSTDSAPFPDLSSPIFNWILQSNHFIHIRIKEDPVLFDCSHIVSMQDIGTNDVFIHDAVFPSSNLSEIMKPMIKFKVWMHYLYPVHLTAKTASFQEIIRVN